MPWFYVDDGFSDSKPVLKMDKAIRAAAIGVWTLCGSWAAKEMTDGYVPMEKVRQLGGTPRIVRALVQDAELWSDLRPDSDRILFRNWSKWQKTRAEVLEKRRQENERKQRWRKGRTGADAEKSTRDTFGDAYTDSEESPRGTPALPDPTRPLVENLGVLGPVGSGPDSAHAELTPFCDKHPGGTRQRCGDCANARRAFEAWEAIQTEVRETEARRIERERIVDQELAADCPDCRGAGWVLDADGTPVDPAVRCDHLNERRRRRNG